MPHVQHQRQRITRNRSGCWACKARRRRCTEEQPACADCVRRGRGHECKYGVRLLWEDAARSAGIAFGRVGMKERFLRKEGEGQGAGMGTGHFLLPVGGRGRLLWLNTTAQDVERFCGGYCVMKRGVEGVEEMVGMEVGLERVAEWVGSPDIGLREHLGLDQEASFLFDYYVKELCRHKVLIDGAQNPFRHLVLPLCSSSSTLLHAVVAVSANDLRNRSDMLSNQRYEQRLLFHKSASLRALRRLFESCEDGFVGDNVEAAATDMTARDSVLLTVLMHCHLEIASGSRHEWISHLKGARSVIQYYEERNQQSASALFSAATLQFVHDYFSLRNIFSATALDQNSHWSLQPPLPPLRSCHDMARITVDIGLSPELLDIISSTTSLARRKHHLRHNTSAHTLTQESRFLEAAHVLQQRLDNLTQWADEPDPNHLIYLNAAAFKTAAHIYLRHGAFDDAPSSPAIQSSYLPTLLAQLQHIHATQGAKVGASPYPMWALFIASCVVGEADRAVALGSFADLKKCRPISNVPTTMAAVEAVWKMKDLEAARPDAERRRTAFEWEEALTSLGWQMPLT